MLIKVITIVETVVYVESSDFDQATIKAKEIVVNNCYRALRDDIGNSMGDIPLAFQEIKKVGELPRGYDGQTVPWGDGDSIKCRDGIR